MWPIDLRRAAEQGADALGDAILRMAAALLAGLFIAAAVLLKGGAAVFLGALVVLLLPVIVWPRLFGLLAGNLMIVLAGLVFLGKPGGGLTDDPLRALCAVPFFIVALFLMIPQLAGLIAMRFARPRPPVPVVVAAPLATQKAPEPTTPGPSPPA